jgi:hypothetical protein
MSILLQMANLDSSLYSTIIDCSTIVFSLVFMNPLASTDNLNKASLPPLLFISYHGAVSSQKAEWKVEQRCNLNYKNV